MNFNYQTKTLSFTSGKGGVGKTTISANIAYRLAQSGKKVLIFDADLGMANIDIFFGTRTPFSIMDVLEGNKEIKEVVHSLDKNLSLISGGHGYEKLQNLDSFSRRALLDSLAEVSSSFDYVLIDTSPGIAQNVLQTNAAVQRVNVIITPDPSSFTDSYALIKLLHTKHKVNHFSIICNQVKNHEDGFYLFKRFQDAVQKFLVVGLEFMGSIPLDSYLRTSNYQQKLISKSMPSADSAIALAQITNELLKSQIRTSSKGGLQFMWENITGVA